MSSLHGKLTIVLDLDRTLVGQHGQARPGLQEFLKLCFEKFAHVGVWTAAKREWFDFVYRKTLLPLMPKNADGNVCQFAFVYTEKDCVLEEKTTSFYFGGWTTVIRKPLRKLWNRKTGVFAHMNPHNTLVVDDTSETYSKNRGNAIPIAPYYAGNHDNELFKLTEFLKRLIETNKRTCSVRYIQKENWSAENEKTSAVK